jgi:hypothetical protein
MRRSTAACRTSPSARLSLVAAALVATTAAMASAQTPAPATEGRWYTATIYTVKPGMMNEFRDLVIKELNPAARKGGLQQAAVWRFATGEGDRVLRITLHDSLADRDAPSAVEKGLGAEGFRAFVKKRDALLVSRTSYIGRTRPDLAWNPAGSPAPKIGERYVVKIAQGREADYVKYVQKLIEASKKTGHRRNASQIVFGTDAPAFHSMTLYDSYADLAKGRPPQRGMTPAELEAFNKSAQGLITVVSRDVMVYEAEMSIRPATTTSSR